MPRETTKIKTPKGVEIEVKTYLTGGEVRQIHAIFLRGAELDANANASQDKPDIKNLKADSFIEAEQKTLELAVVSINGTSENILNRLLDLPNDEYQFVVNEISKLTASFLAGENK